MPTLDRNFRTIDRVWHEQISEHPDHTDFDLEFAKAHSLPSLNAVSEQHIQNAEWRLKQDIQDMSDISSGLVLWLPVIIALANRWLRIVLIVLLIASGIGFGVLRSFPGTILRCAFPPTYHFYDDFTYVKGLNWTAGKSQKNNIIIAYERIPWYPGNYREALLMNGSVVCLHENCIRLLLAEQEHWPPLQIQGFVCGKGAECEKTQSSTSVTPPPQPAPARPILAPGN